jgi:hypothetical protein
VAQLTPTAGKHNLYFVFKNEKAGASQVILQVSGIEVQQQAPTETAISK